jgi:lysophospholipase L1-like esterase
MLVVPAVVAVLGARVLRVTTSVKGRQRDWTDYGHGDFRIVALGDSLTQGIGSSTVAKSWLGLFMAHIALQTGRTVGVDNRAVYGAKIADLVANQLPLGPDVDLVTLCIGANDAGRTDPAVFRAALREVCALLPAGSIVGDVPEFQWGPRVPAAAEMAKVVREVVAEYPELVLARVEHETRNTRIFGDLAGDWFHPGNKGYISIARAFIDAADQSFAIDQSLAAKN